VIYNVFRLLERFAAGGNRLYKRESWLLRLKKGNVVMEFLEMEGEFPRKW
jgi:hypothetical protein